MMKAVQCHEKTTSDTSGRTLPRQHWLCRRWLRTPSAPKRLSPLTPASANSAHFNSREKESIPEVLEKFDVATESMLLNSPLLALTLLCVLTRCAAVLQELSRPYAHIEGLPGLREYYCASPSRSLGQERIP